jgi:hypothetical protein
MYGYEFPFACLANEGKAGFMTRAVCVFFLLFCFFLVPPIKGYITGIRWGLFAFFHPTTSEGATRDPAINLARHLLCFFLLSSQMFDRRLDSKTNKRRKKRKKELAHHSRLRKRDRGNVWEITHSRHKLHFFRSENKNISSSFWRKFQKTKKNKKKEEKTMCGITNGLNDAELAVI